MIKSKLNWSYINNFNSFDNNRYDTCYDSCIGTKSTKQTIFELISIDDLTFAHMRDDYTIELLLKFPTKSWNWRELIKLYKWDFFIENHLIFNWTELLRYYDYQKEELISKLPDYLFVLLSEKNINESIVKQYIHKPWDFYKLELSFEFILNNFNKNWNWNMFSSKRSWQDIMKYPNFQWNFKILALRKDINPLILYYFDSSIWNWRHFVRNPIFTNKFVFKHWRFPWKGRLSCIRRNSAATIIQREFRKMIESKCIGLKKFEH